MTDRAGKALFLASVFAIATCGLIYELVSSTLASYLLGDSVTQFSTVIGVYLFAMGIGSYLSKHVHEGLIGVFVRVELLIGLVGGFSATALFMLFPHVQFFRTALYALILLIGILVGLEIPLLLRILKGRFEFKDLVSKVFTFDYIGALLASLLFPLVLAPHLGLMRTSFLFGAMNVIVALIAIHLLRSEIHYLRLLRGAAFLILLALGAGFFASERLMAMAETATYEDPVIFATSSPYQRIVLSKRGPDLRLHLNGNLQFSSRDEYRYHEAFIHPVLSTKPNCRHVLVLGGGDGMAVREILKYPQIESVVLVDLDATMTRLFSTEPILLKLNENSLLSPKVRVINDDAFTWLKTNTQLFDVVCADFPDPSNFSLGKLYTTAFYSLVRDAMDPDGIVVVQSTSPYVARKSFWCIDRTLKAVGLQTTAYHVYVPSFGEWGFIAASKNKFIANGPLPSGLKFLNPQTMAAMFEFPNDMATLPTEPNRLNNQILVRYFEEEWAHYLP
ncbi:MAG TPA: polyamine aminopropyltransferase [Verrucomicrobiae bacterium]